MRAGLLANGRSKDAVKIFSMATVIVAETDEAARAKLNDCAEYVDLAAALALFAGWTGVDLSGADPDAPLEYIKTEANQSALAAFTTLDPSRVWTARELARFVAIGGRGPVIVGSPATVVDELERWLAVADVDGFNISAAVRPADVEEFARLVSPELRRRGLLTDSTDTTFRGAVFGNGARLAGDHRGAGFRAGATPVTQPA